MNTYRSNWGQPKKSQYSFEILDQNSMDNSGFSLSLNEWKKSSKKQFTHLSHCYAQKPCWSFIKKQIYYPSQPNQVWFRATRGAGGAGDAQGFISPHRSIRWINYIKQIYKISCMIQLVICWTWRPILYKYLTLSKLIFVQEIEISHALKHTLFFFNFRSIVTFLFLYWRDIWFRQCAPNKTKAQYNKQLNVDCLSYSHGKSTDRFKQKWIHVILLCCPF